MAAPFGMGEVGDILAQAKHFFGSEEELTNRVNAGYEPDRIPSNRFPSFRQIEPTISGVDLNNPSLLPRQGDLKYSDESV